MTSQRSQGSHESKAPPYDFKIGDQVVYHPVGGSVQTSVGVIRDILTEPEAVETNDRPVTVKASEEMPRFLIENFNTGKTTAYKRENIEHLASEEEGGSQMSGGGGGGHFQGEPIVQH